MREIRLYVEGSSQLRRGFGEFFSEIRERARSQRVKWTIVVCGSRNSTIEDFFKKALPSHPDAFNVLLVDSDGPVQTQSPWDHLKGQPNATRIDEDIDDDRCHLMVQMMEAWFIADIENIEKHYGREFRKTAIPKNHNVEEIDKDRIASALKNATRNTRKGEYHKTRHAPDLLARIRLDRVRHRASFCNRLVQTLLDRIN